MAQIDELVAQIADSNLRELIAAQVKTLTSRKEFGLIFQQHSPETVLLPKQLVRTGDTVVRREDQYGTRYNVIRAKGEEARVIEIDKSGNAVDNADTGLVDRASVMVIKDVKNGIYPGLKLLGECGQNAPGRRPHVVIKGENYHALRALEYTHRGKVDLIYIDPPYNTGAADWKYNDKFIDSSDAYRHSKWLSFMQKRLEVAKELLKDTGVLVMAIDDNEHHRLRMLADRVFGEANFLANIIWQGNVKNDAKYGGGGIDYMMIYAKNSDSLTPLGGWNEPKEGLDRIIAAGADAWESSGRNEFAASKLLRRWFTELPKNDPARLVSHYNNVDGFDGRPGAVFFASPMIAPEYRPNRSRIALTHPATGEECLVPENGWRYSTETLLRMVQEGSVYFGSTHKRIPNKKTYIEESAFTSPKSSFSADRRSAGKHLSALLSDKRFPFPKNHDVLMRWFRMIAPKDAIVVDFFAGSGTTAEAVIRLNEEDGGTRQSILVTNNELSRDEDKKLRKQGYEPGDDEYEALGVFHHVTMPRISTVLTGIREDGSKYSDGISGQSSKFYELTYEDENLVSLGHKFEAVAPLLWMQAGCDGEVIDKLASQSTGGAGYTIEDDTNYAVIFNIDAAGEAIQRLLEGTEYVFVVTDSTSEFQSVVKLLPPRIQGTAHMLYSDYLRSFAIRK